MEDNGLEARMMNPAKGLEKASGKGLVARARGYMGLNLAAIGLAAALGGCAAGDVGSSPRVIVLPGGTRVTIPAKQASLDDRISLEGTSIDPKHEEFVNHVKDYVVANYITRDFTKGTKALTELRKYGIIERHTMDIREMNEFLMPKGVALTMFFDAKGAKVISIYEIFKQDKYNAHAFGEYVGTYERVLLGKKLFSTHGGYGASTSFKADKTKNAVIFIPYLELQKIYYNSKALDERIEIATLHEVHHNTHSLSEVGAELFALGAGVGKKFNSAEDIVKDLSTQELTYSNGMRLFLNEIFKSSWQPQISARKLLTDLAREINQIDSKYSLNRQEWSNEQVGDMSKLLYDGLLQQGVFRKLY